MREYLAFLYIIPKVAFVSTRLLCYFYTQWQRAVRVKLGVFLRRLPLPVGVCGSYAVLCAIFLHTVIKHYCMLLFFSPTKINQFISK